MDERQRQANRREIEGAKVTKDRVGAINSVVRDFQEALKQAGLFRSCLNCEHWNVEDHSQFPESCAKFGNRRPPARIIVTGCDHHSDEIPF